MTEPLDNSKSHCALVLFAPKFCNFGVDIAKELASQGVVTRVHGLCTGGSKVVGDVSSGLGALAGEIVDIELAELEFLSGIADRKLLEQIERYLPVGATGRILTADRRIGSGFVNGGRVAPSLAKRAARRRPDIIPEVYCAKLVTFLSALLRRTKPDFIFLYANAGAVGVALCELAKAENIPVFGLVPARVGSLFVVDRLPLGELTVIESVEASQLTDADKAYARDSLLAFRQLPVAPDYMKLANRSIRPSDLARNLALAVLDTFRAARGSILGRKCATRWFGVQNRWYQLADTVRRATASERYFRREMPKDRRVIYFPLHVDPEASTMVLSPYHTNQLAIVEALAKSLPADAVLAVKEHRPMLGRRPKNFYQNVASMPRVVLLSPRIDSLECVKQADLTVVITGTAAWEAVRLGKPALVIGNSPFLQIGEGLLHEPFLSKLPEAIIHALALPKASDAALIGFLARLHAVSFPLKASLLWGNYLEHDAEVREAAVRALTQKLIGYLDP